jgi:hypothetical protein
MPPVEAPVVIVGIERLAMLLPKFVREKKRDDQKRHNQKCAQYQMLDHGDLQIDKAETS